MKRPANPDIQRIEKKIDLLNDKLDRLMEAQGIKLEKTPEQIDKEEEKKRKARERQQAKILQEQNIRMHVERHFENLHLKYQLGYSLQEKFNLATTPSAARIREYQRTNDPKAFDGLKRRN